MRFVILLLGLVACGPQPGDACTYPTDGATCSGGEVLICLCERTDATGDTCEVDATWVVDAACSCSGGGSIVCS